MNKFILIILLLSASLSGCTANPTKNLINQLAIHNCEFKRVETYEKRIVIHCFGGEHGY